MNHAFYTVTDSHYGIKPIHYGMQIEITKPSASVDINNYCNIEDTIEIVCYTNLKSSVSCRTLKADINTGISIKRLKTQIP